MNNLFGNQKTQTLDGGMSQTNPFKDTIEKMTNVDERFENMQRVRNFNDLQMERSFQNMKLEDFHEMNNMSNMININSENQILTTPNMNFQERNIQNSFINYNTGPMMNNMHMPQIHPMLVQFNQDLQKEPVKEQSKSEGKEVDSDILADIIKTMEGQDDERHLNSEFLKFIKRMKTGEIKLNEKDNTILEENQEKLEYNKYKYSDDIEDNMEEIWNKLENQIHGNMDENYTREYQKEPLLLKDNPFLGVNDQTGVKNLNEYARDMMDKGDTVNARYALEAEVSKNSDNAEAWLNLGKMHTENDRDDLAIECFLKALDADPFNADALLALGFSCTNEFDEFEAMIHLRNWIKLHHTYNKYFDKDNLLLNYDMIKAEMANDRDEEDYYTKAVRIQGLKENFYKEMINLMETIAVNEMSQDTDLWIALGIANFIPHQNEKAIQCFRRAVEINPKDHSAWNKLGAILAHSKMNEEAIATYKKALSLKPNYARCWANLGIAHLNQNNYEESMRSFLSALKVYKDIGQVWSLLSSIAISLNRTDLYELVQNRNLEDLLKCYNMI
jgi:peroxin-5